MIKISKLKKTYKKPSPPFFSQKGNSDFTALNGVSLSIEKGSIFGIIGKSGAGKSTLIHCLNLLEKPDSGSIKINDVEITQLNSKNLREERRKIGMVFQDFRLLYSKTVFENIALPLKLIKASKKEINEKVNNILSFVDLSEYAKHYPSHLSGGQKQRVAIARALISEPELLLCDEITSALDPQTSNLILDLLKKINKTLSLTIIFITHQMDVIKNICDKVAVLEQGKIIEQGDVLQIFTHPKESYTQDLIKHSLKLDLPQSILNRVSLNKTKEAPYPILKFIFIGAQEESLFLSEIYSKFSLKFNILQANIELIQEISIGVVLIQIKGDNEVLEQLIHYSSQKKLNMEILGYTHEYNV